MIRVLWASSHGNGPGRARSASPPEELAHASWQEEAEGFGPRGATSGGLPSISRRVHSHMKMHLRFRISHIVCSAWSAGTASVPVVFTRTVDRAHVRN